MSAQDDRSMTSDTHDDCNVTFRRVVPCVNKIPEPHERGEFPMTCYPCHVWADS